jgi:hypothetical protein
LGHHLPRETAWKVNQKYIRFLIRIWVASQNNLNFFFPPALWRGGKILSINSGHHLPRETAWKVNQKHIRFLIRIWVVSQNNLNSFFHPRLMGERYYQLIRATTFPATGKKAFQK